MKKIALACILLGFTVWAQAQSLELLRQNSTFFQEKGFPANEYNFEDREINGQLHLALKANKSTERANIMGYVCIGVGVAAMLGGATILPTNRDNFGNRVTRVFGIALITAGGACTIASLGMFGLASSKARDRDKAIQNAKLRHAGLIDQ